MNFPDVPPEPTSEVDAIARDEHFPVYELVVCPDCNNEAFQNHGSSDTDFVCRTCRVGKPLLKRKANYGSAWPEVRAWVLERDNYECQKCGSSENELHVHHKENLVWFETTTEAHQPDNLITLCPECHEYGA